MLRLISACFLLPSVAMNLDVGPVGSVPATVESSLATSARQVRQFAFDGDDSTFFASEKNPGADDSFTLVFERPVSLKAVAVKSGKPDGGDRLDSGSLEVSADGKAFEPLARFAEGSARGEAAGKMVKSVRIRPEGEQLHPLVVREIAVDSDPPVMTFKYPIEIAVDVTDAPDLKDWAEKVAGACERAYPMINEELRSDGYKPAHSIRMTFKSSYKGVAEAGGGRITGSVDYFKGHPDDVGAMVHETTHIVQRYRGRNPGWLVEGVADYVRFFKYEPGKIGPIRADRARYNASYRTTAAFLAFVAEKYDKDLVRKLNAAMREGTYKEEMFKDLTGKTVQELDEEWRATLK